MITNINRKKTNSRSQSWQAKKKKGQKWIAPEFEKRYNEHRKWFLRTGYASFNWTVIIRTSQRIWIGISIDPDQSEIFCIFIYLSIHRPSQLIHSKFDNTQAISC